MNHYKDENNKVYTFNDLQVKQGVPDKKGLTAMTGEEAAELLAVEKVLPTEKELAAEAQAYLNSTDYIYLSQKEKGLSDEDVTEKYADIITKRIEQRAIVSVYEDSL